MNESILDISARLVKNGLGYQYLKKKGKPGSIQALSLEITHKCVARCIMCNIWKIPQSVPDLPMDIWLKLLSSDLLTDLRELDITGGEPFIRDDLMDLFSGICGLKGRNLKSLRSIAVTTNGLLTARVLQNMESIMQRLKDESLELVIVCAMDGIGDVHDRIRNYKDAWTKVHRSIEGLISLRQKYPNLIIGLKTTILPANVGELDKIAGYAGSRGLFTIISPCIITNVRYLNPDKEADLLFSREDKERIIRFYQSSNFQWSYHAGILIKYFRKGVIKKPCTCGFNYFFMRSNGQLFLCPLVDSSPGNIQESTLEELLLSEKYLDMRRKIGKFPECSKCTEPGLERYSLPYEGFSYLYLLLRMGRKKFLQMHHHMGLDKYL